MIKRRFGYFAPLFASAALSVSCDGNYLRDELHEPSFYVPPEATGTLSVDVWTDELNVFPNQTARLHAQPSGGVGDYRTTWEQLDGERVLIEGANTLNPSVTIPAGYTSPELNFRVTVIDSTGEKVTGAVRIEVASEDVGAQAGQELTVAEGHTVTLHGHGVGSGVGYHWTQTSGPDVALAGAATKNPKFHVPKGHAGTELRTHK